MTDPWGYVIDLFYENCYVAFLDVNIYVHISFHWAKLSYVYFFEMTEK
jgi:hypothetical protein